MPSTVQNNDSARRVLQRWRRRLELSRVPNRTSLSISVAVSLAVLLSAVAKAEGNFASKSSSAVEQVSVNRRTIRVPLIEGNDIRFTRLSTAAGVPQPRVSDIVHDDQGFLWFGTQYGL